MATGMELLRDKELLSLALWCGVWAAGLSALNLFRFAPWLSLLMGLWLAWGWFFGNLEASVQRLVFELSSIYHEGYGWNVVYWGSHPEKGALMPIFRALAAVLAFPICHSVTRRGGGWSAIVLTLFPLISTLLLADTLPGSGYFLMYLFGLILLILTQGVRRRQVSQGNALCARVALPLAVVLGLIFLLNPQKGYDKQVLADKLDAVFSRVIDRVEHIAEPPADVDGDNPFSAGWETASSISLEDTGPKKQQKEFVMWITASRGGHIYLRGASFGDYDGTTWRRGMENDKANQWPSFSANTKEETLKIATKENHNVIYLPYYCASLSETRRGRIVNEDNRLTYQIPYYPAPGIIQENGAAFSVDDSYTYLSPSTQQWASRLAKEVLGGSVDARNAGEVVYAAQRIGAFVASSADYSLNTPKMPAGEEDFARWFIEDSDTGYCVHFATSAAVLLRGAGIPARYVTGYSVNANANKQVSVTAGDAHAWVEYYVPGFGWTVLDPTPGSASSQLPPVTTPGSTTPPHSTPDLTTPPEDTGETRPGQTTKPTPGDTTAPGNTTAPGDTGSAAVPGEPTDPGGQTAPKKPINLKWVKYLLWPLAVVGMILGQWWVRVRAHKQWLNSNRGNRRALRYWQEAEHMAALLGEDPPKELRTLAQKAKFSQHTLAREELIQMRGYLAACETRLRKHPWYKQLLYRLVYAIY